MTATNSEARKRREGEREHYVPPLMSEIVAHVKAGGEVERWSPDRRWLTVRTWADNWESTLKRYGDCPAYGYRLAPSHEPITEWVPLHQVMGRRIAGQEWPIDEVVGDPTGWTWKPHPGSEERALTVNGDGTVEVLVEDD